MSSLTLVIGATGKVGSLVVQELAARGVAVRAATRRPAATSTVLPPVARAAEFDYDRPETFGPALEGADALFLSVRPGDDESDLTAIPLVDEAIRRGVRHIVSLTAMGVERLEETSLRRIERHVERAGVSWTHLRPNFFMQIFGVPPLSLQLQAGDTLRLPAGDARLSFIHVQDIAEVAVRALLDPVHRENAYTLTGGEALDHHQVTATLARASGRRLRYEPLSDDDARKAMSAGGLSSQRIERLLRFYALVRGGACEPISPDVATILERPPIPFERFAAEWSEQVGQPARSPVPSFTVA